MDNTMNDFENVVDAMNEIKAEVESNVIAKVETMLGDDFGKEGSMDRRRWAQRITDLSVAEDKVKELQKENRKMKKEVRMKTDIAHMAQREMDAEHIRFLEEQQKRSDRDREIEILKEQSKSANKFVDIWGEILRDVDGDDLCDLMYESGWKYNDDGQPIRRGDSDSDSDYSP